MWVLSKAVHTAIVSGKPYFCNSWFIKLEQEGRLGTTGSEVPVGVLTTGHCDMYSNVPEEWPFEFMHQSEALWTSLILPLNSEEINNCR